MHKFLFSVLDIPIMKTMYINRRAMHSCTWNDVIHFFRVFLFMGEYHKNATSLFKQYHTYLNERSIIIVSSTPALDMLKPIESMYHTLKKYLKALNPTIFQNEEIRILILLGPYCLIKKNSINFL